MDRVGQIQKKIQEAGLDAVIISGETNQFYAIGFPVRDGYVIVFRERACLITDQRYAEAAEKALTGSVEVLIAPPGADKLTILRSELNRENAVQIGVEEETLPCGDLFNLQRELACQILPGQDIFRSLRASKSGEELAYMRRAQEISEQALEEVLQMICPGMTERQIGAELIYRMLRHGCDFGDFSPIVVSGERTSLPHGAPSDRVIREGEFLTVDFGCRVNGYCSDMTRTVAVGYATEEMRQVYEIVLEAQLAGIAAAGPGVPGREIDAAARRVIEREGYGEYFVHGFGHGIGLDGHERPGTGPAEDMPLPAGAIISAEPGIYLPGRFGVRIEDVLLITPSGSEVITRMPKQFRIV